jgi:hypothetical protein
VQRLRSIHLYLGCIFAPLLLFFAISGIWQTLRLDAPWLHKLSSIHTADRFKDGGELGSFPLKIVVIAMAASFIVTTILGVVMAFKYGRSRKAASYCLAAGLLVPSFLVLLRIIRGL